MTRVRPNNTTQYAGLSGLAAARMAAAEAEAQAATERAERERSFRDLQIRTALKEVRWNKQWQLEVAAVVAYMVAYRDLTTAEIEEMNVGGRSRAASERTLQSIIDHFEGRSSEIDETMRELLGRDPYQAVVDNVALVGGVLSSKSLDQIERGLRVARTVVGQAYEKAQEMSRSPQLAAT